ncbi:glycosyltransferase [Porifericola rhodea]|uniref:glycosyltransferase n=1 Tax=Porifericola rhodea TaxID=930972 RepID=UPI0026656616|nr:glycosyltransferase [Porifericola rhodea]WKN30492.1 glycosyltransferase [Porifericola rhodea]
MNVKIILKQPYPYGMACTNRIHNYALGLTEAGHNVEIIVPLPLEKKSTAKNKNILGNHQGIDYLYANNTTYRSNNFIKRRIQDIAGPLLAAKHILFQKQPTDVVLVVSNYLYHIFTFKVVSLITGALYIQEKSEFPFVFKKKPSLTGRIFRNIHNKTIYKLFDGILVISESLHSFFESKIGKNSKLLKVPVIVNMKEFPSPDPEAPPFIAYSGNLSDKKDGIISLIKSFAIVSKKHSELKFYVIGKGGIKDEQKVKRLIAELNLERQVILTGYVSREELLYYLSNALALVVAKPDTLQSSTCFPSKIGEYLATGKPVVSTNVGEIPYYLKDLENALLVNAGDHEAFAHKIDFIIENHDQSLLIGRKGKLTAENNFNYKTQGNRISEFLEKLALKKQKGFTKKTNA